MEQIGSMTRRVAAVLAAAGIALMAVGFVLSGFDVRVFSMTLDRGRVELGGVEVENPERLPFVGALAALGTLEVDPPEPPAAPRPPA